MRTIIALILAGALATSSGCATFSSSVVPVVTRILAVVLDAQQVVNSIDQVVDVFFAGAPDSPFRDRYEKVLAKVNTSLNLIVRLSQGTQRLDEERVDAAFADFKVAYQELMALLGEMRLARPVGSTTFLASHGGAAAVNVPPPLALTFSVRAAR